ncbi:MAG: photosystem II complex extrinsic protein PsbU [Synechococcales cyanobacterium CRU_2_2]|nr:photosystem II complex extrinsic protein PsbU [Synechococcales cyanobacterium CRU_2_2]
MKRLISWSMLLVVFFSAVFGLADLKPVQALPLNRAVLAMPVLAVTSSVNEADAKRAEVKDKVDLNNSGVRSFLDMPGMYPTIARKIIANAPYESLDDVYSIPGLSEKQKEIIGKYADRLTATSQSEALTYGGDRINNGIYR